MGIPLLQKVTIQNGGLTFAKQKVIIYLLSKSKEV